MNPIRWLLLLMTATLVGWLLLATRQSGSPVKDLPTIGTFSLTERSGKTITNDSLRGKVWLAGFVFTRCTGPCPQVTATMARLQKSLADVENLRLVTFTVDPERDDPNALDEYAKNFQADSERWLFLTGPEAEIQRVLREEFHVHRVKAEKAAPGMEFDHSTKLILVDQHGRVRGTFDAWPGFFEQEAPGMFEENLTKLQETVRKVAAER